MIYDYKNKKITFESPAEEIDYKKHMAEYGPSTVARIVRLEVGRRSQVLHSKRNVKSTKLSSNNYWNTRSI